MVEAELQAPEPEAEPDASEPLTLEVAETAATEQVPKREEIFAVVMVCMCSFSHFFGYPDTIFLIVSFRLFLISLAHWFCWFL